MKRRVIWVLELAKTPVFERVAKFAALDTNVSTKELADDKRWSGRFDKLIDGQTGDVAFEKPAEADALFTYLSDLINKDDLVEGSVSIHDCTHDDEKIYSCVMEKEVEKWRS